MVDPEGSSSSEDGSEPMEVKIPPEIDRELGQGPTEPTMVAEEDRVVNKPDSEEIIFAFFFSRPKRKGLGPDYSVPGSQ